MALVPEGRIEEIVERIEEIAGDLEKKHGAMVYVDRVSHSQIAYNGSCATMEDV